MRSPLRRSRSHLVDAFGLVGCPRQHRDVPVERCLRCRELVEVRRDPDGAVTEIRCRAGGRRPSAEHDWDPFGPVVGFRP